MPPKVSILIPCYNAEQWIAQAIESAIAQTYPNLEIIVVDDGSTDGSWPIIQQFGDRIHAETRSNQGSNATRNHLLELSTGEWLQYLDADDYLLPDKITQQMQVFSQHPTVDVIYSPVIVERWEGDRSLHPNPTTQFQGKTVCRQIDWIPESLPHDPWILMVRWHLPQTGAVLWRKQAILDVGGWTVHQPCCQENELYLRLLQAGKVFEYAPTPHAVYRWWSESTICRRNPTKTFHTRLALIDRSAAYLQHTAQLTPDRLDAINQSRLECARILWILDRPKANQLIQQIHTTQALFTPSPTVAPSLYRWIYCWFGFSTAEFLAQMKRMVLQSPG